MYVFTNEGNTVIEDAPVKSQYGDVKANKNAKYRGELMRQMNDK